MKVFGWVAAIIAIACLVIGITTWYEATTHNSTEGVTVVDGNTVRLPEDETFVLTHHIGNFLETWEITYDGNDAIRFHCQDGLCSDLQPATLCGVGCVVKVDPGLLEGYFYVSLREDGAVNVKWPQGWTFRPYEP